MLEAMPNKELSEPIAWGFYNAIRPTSEARRSFSLDLWIAATTLSWRFMPGVIMDNYLLNLLCLTLDEKAFAMFALNILRNFAASFAR